MPGVNGWVNPLNLGRYGTDYNTRALIAWLGLGALTSDDAVSPSTFLDADGNALDGAKKYVLHLTKDEIFPSESGVWSVSPYRENFYVCNGINRYGIRRTGNTGAASPPRGPRPRTPCGCSAKASASRRRPLRGF